MLSVVAITLTGCPGTQAPSTINVSVASGNGRVEQSTAGSIVTLTAIPDEGWEFSGWSGADVDDVNPLTVDTNEISSISANFIETQQDPPPTAPVDRDDDGVPDENDACPNTPTGAQVDDNGCPIGDPNADDTDGDGVGDDIDQCEDTAADAEVDANGCSPNQRDGDGDGVTDDLDQCPDTPEGQTDAVNADGCAPSEIDTDGDGVSDDLDNCADTPPRTTVAADGCPDDSPGDVTA
ncbi:MAG: thrombospondin type 3 repeat-containing protein, partial [Planctomycetes bacterium]|nr:thrombospondin type 3 repeat-containing protein [Planctomycetota bacterium]